MPIAPVSWRPIPQPVAVVVEIPLGGGRIINSDLGDAVAVPVAGHRDNPTKPVPENPVGRRPVPQPVAVVVEIPLGGGRIINTDLGDAVAVPVAGHRGNPTKPVPEDPVGRRPVPQSIAVVIEIPLGARRIIDTYFCRSIAVPIAGDRNSSRGHEGIDRVAAWIIGTISVCVDVPGAAVEDRYPGNRTGRHRTGNHFISADINARTGRPCLSINIRCRRARSSALIHSRRNCRYVVIARTCDQRGEADSYEVTPFIDDRSGYYLVEVTGHERRIGRDVAVARVVRTVRRVQGRQDAVLRIKLTRSSEQLEVPYRSGRIGPQTTCSAVGRIEGAVVPDDVVTQNRGRRICYYPRCLGC